MWGVAVSGRPNRRIPARLRKAFDRYEIRTGTAGFVRLYRNGKRIAPKNATIRFNKRKETTL